MQINIHPNLQAFGQGIQRNIKFIVCTVACLSIYSLWGSSSNQASTSIISPFLPFIPEVSPSTTSQKIRNEIMGKYNEQLNMRMVEEELVCSNSEVGEPSITIEVNPVDEKRSIVTLKREIEGEVVEDNLEFPIPNSAYKGIKLTSSTTATIHIDNSIELKKLEKPFKKHNDFKLSFSTRPIDDFFVIKKNSEICLEQASYTPSMFDEMANTVLTQIKAILETQNFVILSEDHYSMSSIYIHAFLQALGERNQLPFNALLFHEPEENFTIFRALDTDESLTRLTKLVDTLLSPYSSNNNAKTIKELVNEYNKYLKKWPDHKIKAIKEFVKNPNQKTLRKVWDEISDTRSVFWAKKIKALWKENNKQKVILSFGAAHTNSFLQELQKSE